MIQEYQRRSDILPCFKTLYTIAVQNFGGHYYLQKTKQPLKT